MSDVYRRRQKLGMMLSEFVHPSMAFVARAGHCDFVIVDAEHGPFGIEDAAGLCAVGMAEGIDVLVRVPDSGRAAITKVLDMGASGVVVPMIASADAAEEVVAHCRYHPDGKRGVSTTRLHSRYDPGPLRSYMSSANDRIRIWVQIETRRGLEDIAGIAAVPGINGLMLGPNDLLQDFGRPGDNTSDELLRAIRTVSKHAHQRGLAAGIISSLPALLSAAVDCNYDLLSVGSDVGMMISATRDRIASVAAELGAGQHTGSDDRRH